MTLNVLLSFAQFEREVTAERIRDKIAASKKKGMWMGGLPPLGYDLRDKKLVINPAEAQQVRRLFEAYLALGSTKALTRWAKENGVTTKQRFTSEGRVSSGNRPFSRGNLHALLKYRTYIGEIAHKGAIYAGEQEAILTRDLWDSVQAKLTASPKHRGSKTTNTQGRPLTGLVLDETGDRLTPVHATKGTRRYYYYISARLNQTDVRDPSGWRLPALTLEQAVVQGLLLLLRDDHQLQRILEDDSAGHIEHAHILQQLLSQAQQLVEKLGLVSVMDQLLILSPLIERIDLSAGKITIQIKIHALLALLGHTGAENGSPDAAEATHSIAFPLVVKRRGVETRLIISDGREPPLSTDQVLIRTIARAHIWFEDLKAGTVASINDVAARENIPACEVSRQLPLAFLAPSIVRAIIAGQQPADLTAKNLRRFQDLPVDWKQQSELLGFQNVRGG